VVSDVSLTCASGGRHSVEAPLQWSLWSPLEPLSASREKTAALWHWRSRTCVRGGAVHAIERREMRFDSSPKTLIRPPL